MAAFTARFSRISALRPTRPKPSGAELLRAPHAEDSLSRLLGAGIATNRYGQHVLVRNWFSSPEQSDMSEVSLELLSRGRDETISKRSKAALANSSALLRLLARWSSRAAGGGSPAQSDGFARARGLGWQDRRAADICRCGPSGEPGLIRPVALSAPPRRLPTRSCRLHASD